MIYFFKQIVNSIYLAVEIESPLLPADLQTLLWLFSQSEWGKKEKINGTFVGPKKEMISPWCTNALDIVYNAGVKGIRRIEKYVPVTKDYDPLLEQLYDGLDQHIFTIRRKRETVLSIHDIFQYNSEENLGMNQKEIAYLSQISKQLQRPLTDSEIYGFSQINSEHCRHKIFNGKFIIDGEQKSHTLFEWIKKSSKRNPNYLVSAFVDNLAFIAGPTLVHFAPKTAHIPDWFAFQTFDSVLSLKAETHNFPTTVEPFYGASTGSGGEIRDRMAGGQGSIPLIGTAVYMTSYPRLEANRLWEKKMPRTWLYHAPAEILIKASNGASDYGNKFGQPLICGSVLTFEHEALDHPYGYDKVIMLAGGVGFARKNHAHKRSTSSNEKIVVLGGDNYRIGLGGGAVSSTDTGSSHSGIELNAVQRANPEMQKRVANVIRAMTEMEINPIVSIHDHGAGGNINCLTELVSESGGDFDLKKFPLGDVTLSWREVLCNESQERMGLVINEKHLDLLKAIALRERVPLYEVGTVTAERQLTFKDEIESKVFDLTSNQLFGATPQSILKDRSVEMDFDVIKYEVEEISTYIKNVLKLESVACKEWLTHKVDRCVTGKVATQQTCGELQLPLNNVGVAALDYVSEKGIATSIGHAPVASLIQVGAGVRLSVTEALTNLVFAPLTHALKGVSLSVNWMWPANNPGENRRLYEAVEAISTFVSDLGINIVTGKDSLSMTQKYPDGNKVLAPGTVIVSTVAEVNDVNDTVSPVVDVSKLDSKLLYVDFSGSRFELGGSCLAQTFSNMGEKVPDADPQTVISAFNAIQNLVSNQKIIAGHDVSAGGMITTLLEMNFANQQGGMEIDLTAFSENDLIKILFSEKPALIIQIEDEEVENQLKKAEVTYYTIGKIVPQRQLLLNHGEKSFSWNIDEMRTNWYHTSYLLDKKQTGSDWAKIRKNNRFDQPLSYHFPPSFDGKLSTFHLNKYRKATSGVQAAIIREQGSNSDREMAFALWLAGFDVKDVHTTDLTSGREDLTEVNMIVFVGGFSNSDVLGAAKGWAGSLLFNPKAKKAIDNFFARTDTLSLGVCNGCQLMTHLKLIEMETDKDYPKMYRNLPNKFECGFVNVTIVPSHSIMLKNMEHARLGIWLAHGEGRFQWQQEARKQQMAMKYSYNDFPGNANGSDLAAAAIVSTDGRHLAVMPHLERSLFPWNWAYKKGLEKAEISPWIIPFLNAFNWIKENQ